MTKAAALRDVCCSVEDSQLILTLLLGLNPRFSNTADDIANSAILPSFAGAHDMLALKELRLANDEKIVVNTTLLTTGASSYTNPGECHSTTAAATSGGNSRTTGGNEQRPQGWRWR